MSGEPYVLDPAGMGELELSLPASGARLPEGMREGPAAEVVVSAIRVGRACYPLRKRDGEVVGHFQPGRRGKGRAFCVDPFLPYFVGEGASDEEALKNWCELIHVSFQRLRATCETRLDDKEREQWGLLYRELDVAAYDASRPVKARQRGEVVRAFPDPWEVRWAADEQNEAISLDQVPDEFAALRVGDWFEAVLSRDSASRKLLHVHEVRPITPKEPMTAAEAKRFWRSLAQKKDLPESGCDWTKP